MEEFKGTPGPWFDDSTSPCLYDITGQDGRTVVRIEPNDEIDDFNFMLLAAAPELLEALLGLVGSYDDFRTRIGKPESPQANEIIKARAAIAKALGKE